LAVRAQFREQRFAVAAVSDSDVGTAFAAARCELLEDLGDENGTVLTGGSFAGGDDPGDRLGIAVGMSSLYLSSKRRG